MKPVWWSGVEDQIDSLMQDYVVKIGQKLEVTPANIVLRKNPFLYRVRAIEGTDQLATMLVDAYLSSSEETIFGNTLEGIAIAICSHSKGGRKSGISNIDLEYDEGSTRTVIQIKSGPNWGNSSQHKSLLSSFTSASKILRQGSKKIDVRCVEGICYGKSKSTDRGSHLRLIGDDFWFDISGSAETPQAIMQMIGGHAGNGLYEARKKAEADIVEYLEHHTVSRSNKIDWERLSLLLFKG